MTEIMAGDNDITFKKWKIVKEQLILLVAMNPNAKTSADLRKMLVEDVSLKNITSQILMSLCHFLLGVIDAEERDKLIKWPVINIQTNAKFRKGLSAMLTNFMEKYPWAHIKKLPESYLVTPHSVCQKKLVDFLSRLTNLAIHLVINDVDLLMMHSGIGVNEKEIEVMREIISKAIQVEERVLETNVFQLDEFEIVKNETIDKCIALKEENTKLEQKIHYLFKCAVGDGMIKAEKDGIEGLKAASEKKLSELSKINDELAKYHNASDELLSKLKALKNPVSLTANDFNGENASLNLTQETVRVCERLQDLFQVVSTSSATNAEETVFHEKLVQARSALERENEALKNFICKMSPLVQ